MTLRDPETRKALRAIVGAVIALSLTAMVWWFAPGVSQRSLATLLSFALVIVGLRVFFDGAENVTNAVSFKMSSSGIEGSVSEDDTIKNGDTVTVEKS